MRFSSIIAIFIIRMRAIDLSIDLYFKQHYRPLCLYALHFVEDTDLAEDIVQDAFVALWERHEEVRDIRSYLYASVRNGCLTCLRKRSGYAKAAIEDIPVEELEDTADKEVRLWSAIDGLPDRRRQILLLAKRDGLKYEEIASRLGISISTVRNQMSKALAALKEIAWKIYTFFFCAG